MEKPVSPSCERNREPILEKLKDIISSEHSKLLEIGSGTGQHAVYFAPEFPHLTWTTSDMKSNHFGIKKWLKEKGTKNIEGPLDLEFPKSDFPKGNFDIVYCCNTIHIMGWKTVKTMMKTLGKNLKSNALVIFYGPFNYHGDYTSESNREFDKWLKDRDPQSGIRAFEDVTNNMVKNGFYIESEYKMPANNRLLVYKKA